MLFFFLKSVGRRQATTRRVENVGGAFTGTENGIVFASIGNDAQLNSGVDHINDIGAKAIEIHATAL